MLIPSVFGGSLFDDFDTIFAEPWFGHNTNKTPQKSYAYQRKRLMNTDVKETKENYILVLKVSILLNYYSVLKYYMSCVNFGYVSD